MLLYISKKQQNYNFDKKTALLYQVACETKNLFWSMEIAKHYAKIKNISIKEASKRLKEL